MTLKHCRIICLKSKEHIYRHWVLNAIISFSPPVSAVLVIIKMTRLQLVRAAQAERAFNEHFREHINIVAAWKYYDIYVSVRIKFQYHILKRYSGTLKFPQYTPSAFLRGIGQVVRTRH